jgi:hypothetical protein
VKLSDSTHCLLFDGPAEYLIRVQGKIQPDKSGFLEGMTIIPTVSEYGLPLTTLTGELNDQAALAGILNVLYEMHFPVLTVQCLSAL